MTRYGDYTEISDEDRLLWLVEEVGLDIIGEHDLHELACTFSEGEKHPDLLAAVRWAIDHSMSDDLRA